MQKIIFLLIFLFTFSIKGQHTISGTFSPAKEYSWVIAYKLKPGTQVYAADTAIKNGEFSMIIPENAPKGTYRLVYAVPQEEFYFDVIYNGKEDIKLAFESTKGVTFTESEENILFGTYLERIQDFERKMITFYSNGSTDVKEYKEIVEKYQKVQKDYEGKSEGLWSNQFIKANRPYIPTNYESLQDYIQNRKKSYFKNLDIANPTLQASGFLTDKLTNYVFTALPLEELGKAETEKEIQRNIDTVIKNLKNVSETYSFHFLYTLWAQSSGNGFLKTADFIYNTYLKNSSGADTNKDIIDKIEIYNRLRVGARAPEITWQKGSQSKNLSTLQGVENYVLIFWSSTCGHCLNELPALHKELKENNNVKVVAIGLENDDSTWKIESSKLEFFEHAIALGKWDSEYAKLYDIHATPTYFVLDKEKKIIAKPETDREVIEFLRKEF